MKEKKRPFVIEGVSVYELIGQNHVCAATGVEKPEVIRYPSEGDLIVVKTEKGIDLFYDDQARGRTVKAHGAQKLCEAIGEIAYIDEDGNAQRLARLTTRQVGENMEEEFFPET